MPESPLVNHNTNTPKRPPAIAPNHPAFPPAFAAAAVLELVLSLVAAAPPALELVDGIEVTVGKEASPVLDISLPLAVPEDDPVEVPMGVFEVIPEGKDAPVDVLELEAAANFSSPAVIGIAYHVAELVPVYKLACVVAGMTSLPRVASLSATLKVNVPVIIGARVEEKV
tara:strand:- start:6 stop:515 length:510 start_codon:yes stop_codon:yes gene_type:complete